MMPEYRLYWMNGPGHIEQVGEFDAEDNNTAISAVEHAELMSKWNFGAALKK